MKEKGRELKEDEGGFFQEGLKGRGGKCSERARRVNPSRPDTTRGRNTGRAQAGQQISDQLADGVSPNADKRDQEEQLGDELAVKARCD